jgi:hypothetical protein
MQQESQDVTPVLDVDDGGGKEEHDPNLAWILRRRQDLSNKHVSPYAIFTILFAPFLRQALENRRFPDEHLPKFMDLSNIFGCGGGPRSRADSRKGLSCAMLWALARVQYLYFLPSTLSSLAIFYSSATSMSATDHTTENESLSPCQAPIDANE